MLVPQGDILVHCGDILDGFECWRPHRERAVADFFDWLNNPELHRHPVKIVIGGNHDKVIASKPRAAIRAMAAPALYLEDESAVVEPVGLRLFGTPRSSENSRLSPNSAWQSPQAWKPFHRVTEKKQCEDSRCCEKSEELVSSHTPLLQENSTARGTPTSCEKRPSERKGREAEDNSFTVSSLRNELSVHLEGEVARGPVDILVSHQSPEYPRKTCPISEQPIVGFINSVTPRRLHLGGHLHGSHGLHRIPTPSYIARNYGYASANSAGAVEVVPLPFFPSINAAMMKGSFCNLVFLPACVIDIEI